MLYKFTHQKFDIYSEKHLSDKDLKSVVEALKIQASPNEDHLLSGRGTIKFTELDGIGPVAIKKYLRGGLLGKIIKKYYVQGAGKLRPQIEYEALLIARKCGIKAPCPHAFVIQGQLLYQAWLIMEKIEHQDNLASISLKNPEFAQGLMPEVCRIITTLVDNMIFHPDLHPGNFLMTLSRELYLIDFDKAAIFSGPPSKLQEVYLLRWRRAVIKHNLPDFLAEYVSASLRKK